MALVGKMRGFFGHSAPTEVNMTFFKSKVILITGSGGGLGRYLAGAYFEAGAYVVLCDIHEERLKAAEEELSGKGRVFAQKVDVGDEESVKGLFKAAFNKFGRIDVVVNNAAIFDALDEYPFCFHCEEVLMPAYSSCGENGQSLVG